MRSRAIILIMIALAVQTTYSFAQLFCGIPREFTPEKIRGGYKQCSVFFYYYNSNGVLDLSSKELQSVYLFDDSGNRISEVRYTPEDTTKYTYKYDKKGNKIEWLMNNWIKTYKYDEMWNKIEKVEFIHNQSVMKTNIYRYDNKGYLVSTPSDNIINKYDVHGNLIETTHYNSDTSEIRIKTIYKYDVQRNKIEEIEYDSDLSFSQKETYRYDGNNNLIERIKYIPDTSVFLKVLYKYDSNNNKIEEIEYFGSIALKSKLAYGYDDFGNKIEEVSYKNINEPFAKTIYVYSK